MTSPSSDPELTPSDVETYTGGRLGDDATTAQLLASALAAARRYCGWHVNPVRVDDEVTVDGTGGWVLSLPTMNLLSVREVDEDGITWGPEELRISRTRGTVTKRSGGRWTAAYGAVTAVMTHGFTNAEAAEWRQGVLRLTDLMARESSDQRDSAALIRKRVDDVEYQWAATLISTDARLAALFSAYRILPSP